MRERQSRPSAKSTQIRDKFDNFDEGDRERESGTSAKSTKYMVTCPNRQRSGSPLRHRSLTVTPRGVIWWDHGPT